MTVNEYMQKQIDISEKLYYCMREDYNKNNVFISNLSKTIHSLLEKLEVRDKQVEQLRAKIAELEKLEMPVDEQCDA
jgi:predicted RNase H-like nuclease (RuvC/YqgF family)